MVLVVSGTLAFACKAPDPGPALQILGDSGVIRSGDPVPHSSPYFDGATLTLVAARGETLGLQVLHRGGGPVSLTIDHAHVQAFDVEPAVAVHASTDLYGGGRGAGSYPDLLAPVTVAQTDPAYFEVTIDRDESPIRRQGTLVVGTRKIPVDLTISPVTLRPHRLDVWAYYDPRELAWANLGAGTVDAPSAEERACIAMFGDHGVLLSPDLPVSAWPARRDLLARSPYVPASISDDPAAAGDAVHAWIAATDGTGRVPFAIPIDEPHTPEARARVKALSAAVRAAGGGPDRFLYAVTAEPRPDDGDLVDLYIPLRARRGQWTYNGAPPRAGSVVLDAVAPGPRTWGWIGWRYEIPLWYVWDALYWHDRHNRKGAPLPGRALDPRTDATSFDDGDDRGNLDGVLAVPGDATTPCRPTLRLAALRRGQQDRALLELAAHCHPTETAALAERMIPSALADAPEHGAGSWPTDEATWERARRELLELAACP